MHVEYALETLWQEAGPAKLRHSHTLYSYNRPAMCELHVYIKILWQVSISKIANVAAIMQAKKQTLIIIMIWRPSH